MATSKDRDIGKVLIKLVEASITATEMGNNLLALRFKGAQYTTRVGTKVPGVRV